MNSNTSFKVFGYVDAAGNVTSVKAEARFNSAEEARDVAAALPASWRALYSSVVDFRGQFKYAYVSIGARLEPNDTTGEKNEGGLARLRRALRKLPHTFEHFFEVANPAPTEVLKRLVG